MSARDARLPSAGTEFSFVGEGNKYRQLSRTLGAVAWAVLFSAAVGLGLASAVRLELSSLVIPGLLLSGLSTHAFLKTGGVVVNASSTASYAILLFCGFPAVYIGLGLYSPASRLPTGFILAAISMCFLLQLLVYALASKTSAEPVRMARTATGVGPRILLSAMLFGGAVLARVQDVLVLAVPLGMLAILFAADAALSRPKLSSFVLASMYASTLSLVYAEIIFAGFGRLVLGVIGCALTILASLYFRTYWIKFGLLVLTAPALIYLSLSRLAFLQDIRGSSADSSEGIGSVIGPLVSLGHIVRALWVGAITPDPGSTFWAAIVIWIPRSVWPSKPDGFGTEMVSITQPQLFTTQAFSDAALLPGELVWNFGLVGGAVSMVVFVLLLRVVDRRMTRQAEGGFPPQTAMAVVNRLLVVFIAASLLNLLWGGTFTFVSRALAAMILLLAMAATLHMFREIGGRRPKSGRPFGPRQSGNGPTVLVRKPGLDSR